LDGIGRGLRRQLQRPQLKVASEQFNCVIVQPQKPRRQV
jgi:hypothetical protein